MNKQELIEELNRSLTDHDEIRISIERKDTEELTKSLARLKRKIGEVGKLAEELYRDHGIRWESLNEKLDELDNEYTDLEETILQFERNSKEEVVADTVTHGYRRLDSGGNTPAIIISE